jgi:hydrogenase nickel incorporation protein HypA/HybF
MHELSIAAAIVEACVERALGNRILCIRVEVGFLAAVLPDSLRFCFELCARGTTAEGAALEIMETPGQAICDACGTTIELSVLTGRCVCGNRLRITAGEELKMTNMVVA